MCVWGRKSSGVLAVGGEVRATRFRWDAKWLQLERRLVSEVVGFGCEIHITQMYLWLDDVFVDEVWGRWASCEEFWGAVYLTSHLVRGGANLTMLEKWFWASSERMSELGVLEGRRWAVQIRIVVGGVLSFCGWVVSVNWKQKKNLMSQLPKEEFSASSIVATSERWQRLFITLSGFLRIESSTLYEGVILWMGLVLIAYLPAMIILIISWLWKGMHSIVHVILAQDLSSSSL